MKKLGTLIAVAAAITFISTQSFASGCRYHETQDKKSNHEQVAMMAHKAEGYANMGEENLALGCVKSVKKALENSGDKEVKKHVGELEKKVKHKLQEHKEQLKKQKKH